MILTLIRTQIQTPFLTLTLNSVGVEKTETLRFKAEELVQNFKEFKHHMARVAQQELHWHASLREMKEKKQFHMVNLENNFILKPIPPIINQLFLPYRVYTQIGVNKIRLLEEISRGVVQE